MQSLPYARTAMALAARQDPTTTQRSPLLYTWFALQAAIAIVIIYLIVHFVRRARNRRVRG